MKYQMCKITAVFISVFIFGCHTPNGNQNNQTQNSNVSAVYSSSVVQPHIQNLVVLGKVWGFLKYYHPAVVNGKYDWDQQLFQILPEILKARTSLNRNDILYNWIDTLGEIEKGEFLLPDSIPIKLKPNLEWIESDQLGKKLSMKLSAVKTAKRNGNPHYVRLTGIKNPNFANEKMYKGMAYPDSAFRLLSLFRYWNIIQYYFPYREYSDENWNNVLEKFVPVFLNARNELEYKLEVLKLIAHVQDTHANIWNPDSTLEKFNGMYYAPVDVDFIENKAVVTGYLNKDLGMKTELIKGDIINTVDGKSVTDIIKERAPFYPASNYPTQLRNIAAGLLRSKDSGIVVTYIRNGKTNKTTISGVIVQRLGNTGKFQRNDTCFKMISSDIAYLYLGSIRSKYLPELMPQIQPTKGLIIDLRCYPREFVVFTLGEYLMPRPTEFVKFTHGNLEMPGLFTFTPPLTVGKENANYYKGRVVILINEITQSQAEYTTMAFRKAPDVTVIGSTTAGADGNISPFYLPGDLYTMISGLGVYYPDGKATQRIGIVPDIEVKPTIKGIMENRDELMEKAIEVIQSGKK